MTLVTDFLDRFAQHIDAQKQRLDPHQNPLTFVANAFLQPARGALDTVGLGLEGTARLGEYAAGETLLPLAAVQVAGANAGLPGFDPNSTATQASQAALDQGPLHPRAALDAVRNGPDSLAAWLAGGLAMAEDPANLIGLPAKAASETGAAARLGKLASAEGVLSPEFEKGAAQDALEKFLHSMGTNVIPNEPAITDPLAGIVAKLQAKRPIDEIFGIADKAKAAGAARDEVGLAKQDVLNAKDVYKNVQDQKQAAVNEALAEFRKNGRLPRNFKMTPEYTQRVDETKNAVELLNPQGPQNRATFGTFVQDQRANLGEATRQQQAANKELQSAFGLTTKSPITGAQAGELAGPEALAAADMPTGVQEALANGVDPALAQQRSGDLGALNAQENAFANSVTPQATPEESPHLFPETVPVKLETVAPSPLPPAAKTPENPQYLASVKDQVTQVANLAPPQSMYPELDDPQAGRMIDLINHAFKEGLVAQKEAYSRPWKKLEFSDLGSVWYGINIDTVKNLLSDPIFAKFVLRNNGVAASANADNTRIIVNRLVTGEKDPLALFGTLGDILVQLGLHTEKGDSKYARDVIAKLGGNPFDSEAEIANELNGMQQALLGAGIQLANPVRATTGILTAPLNLLIPMRHRMFHIINNVTHVASRVAAFEQAAFPFLENSAKTLLERAAAEGKDVSALQGRGLVRAGDVLTREGMFSWQEAEKVLGPRYGKEWQALSQQAMEAGYKNSRDVLGNYQLEGTLGAAEKTIRKFVPFQSWAWRAYPRAAKYALQHPAVTAGLLHLYALDRAIAAQDGRPGYTVGTVGIGPDTLFVGLLTKVFTPEQESEIRLNPLSLFSPVGGDVLSLGMDDPNASQDQTGYQKLKKGLGLAGASFNPLIQEGAYLTGQDFSAPAPGSRYSNIDLLTGDMGGPTAPTIAGPNKALRAAITGAMGNRQVDNYDPVENKANELVYEATGKVISDPSNAALALDLKNHGPLYQQAQRLLDQGGATRAAFNAVSPVSVSSRTQTTQDRQAAGQPPFSYDMLKQAKDAGLVDLVRQMNAANDQFYRDNPAAAVNKNATLPKEATKDPRILAFEQKNIVLQRYAPKAYAAALADYKKTLGIP
jgi:hypothetical protein